MPAGDASAMNGSICTNSHFTSAVSTCPDCLVLDSMAFLAPVNSNAANLKADPRGKEDNVSPEKQIRSRRRRGFLRVIGASEPPLHAQDDVRQRLLSSMSKSKA